MGRAWLPLLSASLLLAAPAWAATRVTIANLKEHPDQYYGHTLQLECFYDKESPIWARSLDDADRWLGFFVTGKPEKSLTWTGEYYNLLFAPAEMRGALRTLRGGDKITVIGEGFRYASASLEGAGIRVTEIRTGWGPSANALTEPAPSLLMPAASAAPSPPPSPEVTQKYTVTMNGKRYEGLRVGDRYNFDGIEFAVEKTQ